MKLPEHQPKLFIPVSDKDHAQGSPDAPVTPTLNVRAYSHALGSCGVCWMATPAIAKSLRRGFPQSLDGVPILLPTEDTAIRRSLDAEDFVIISFRHRG